MAVLEGDETVLEGGVSVVLVEAAWQGRFPRKTGKNKMVVSNFAIKDTGVALLNLKGSPKFN